MTTPTHRVLRALPAGDFTYHPGDLVDAADWANVRALISTDYMEALSRDEISALASVASPPSVHVDKVPDSPVKPRTTRKTSSAKKSPAKKAVAKKATAAVKTVPRPTPPTTA